MNNKLTKVNYKDYKGEVFVGIDVHRKSYALAIVIEGEIIRKLSVPGESMYLANYLKSLFPKALIKTVYEAGFCGYYLHRHLEEQGIENLIVNPASIQVASRDRVKTDKKDAVKLANQLSLGLIKGIRVRSKEEELKRLSSRTRESLLKDRRRLMLRLRMKLLQFGLLDLDFTGVLTYKYMEEFLKKNELEMELKNTLKVYLNMWKLIDIEINSINKSTREEAKTNKIIQTYLKLPGIGFTCAKLLSDELGDLQQFYNQKTLYNYLGLTPSEYSSGEKVRRGRITRQGNPMVRAKLVECSWIAIRKDPALKASYNKIAARQGGKKAIVAIARKLIGRARAIFRKNEDYKLEFNNVDCKLVATTA
jgi:transposase